jgi:hypothetical protein
MIIQESKIIGDRNSLCMEIVGEQYVRGYFLTIDDLQKLVRDFQVDNFDGFVSNDNSYIESWLNKHEHIIKK